MKIDPRNLKNPIAEGGEGTIYRLGEDILKIFKPHVHLASKRAKVEAMLRLNLPDSIIGPIDIVQDFNNRFIGYRMKGVNGEEVKQLTNKKYCTIHKISLETIMKVLVAIKDTLKVLHQNKIYIGDLNDKNILFDSNYNVYFIDVDSWTIHDQQCEVCMETFKDPLLKGNQFSASTDAFAFAVLAFKLMTRVHPYGGRTDPDMDLLVRMERKLSVIDRPGVIVPKTIMRDWKALSPNLLREIKEIFEREKRFLLDKSLEEDYKNLTYCQKHNDYYFNKYELCPICNAQAKIKEEKILKRVTGNQIPYAILYQAPDVLYMLSPDSYISMDNRIKNRWAAQTVPLQAGSRYYFSEDGEVLYRATTEQLVIKQGEQEFVFDKLFGSDVVVKDRSVYYISPNNVLTELDVLPQGNAIKALKNVSFNSIFNVMDEKHYFICNIYEGKKILTIDGHNFEWINNDKIVSCGIHFDKSTKSWLFTTENTKGNFTTQVFSKNNRLFESDRIKYSSSLDGLAFSNNIIYRPAEGKIIGYSYERNVVKEFPCSAIEEDSILIKDQSYFTVINREKVYRVG